MRTDARQERLAPGRLRGEEGLGRLAVRRTVIVARLEPIRQVVRPGMEPDDEDIGSRHRLAAGRRLDDARGRADDDRVRRRDGIDELGGLAGMHPVDALLGAQFADGPSRLRLDIDIGVAPCDPESIGEFPTDRRLADTHQTGKHDVPRQGGIRGVHRDSVSDPGRCPRARAAAARRPDLYTRVVETPQPIAPPAVIGILGGGQLGRMLAGAARAMGYRIAILDPDPECPAAAVADHVVIGGYADVDAADRLASLSDVVTYELEHVAAEVVATIEARVPVRPGHGPLVVTQDRLAERRFVEGAGVAVAPWREVRTVAEARAAATDLGLPLRLKLPIGGYDGRGQLRIADSAALDDAWGRLGREPGDPLLAERELAFLAELSVIVARGPDGSIATFPITRNHHDDGILVESVAPAPVPAGVAAEAATIGTTLALAMDLCGTLTAELFLLQDGSLVVNELAPRVHNSGHWTIEGAHTSQFEQHIRAICGSGLGSPAASGPVAMVNLLGTGAPRDARLRGVATALTDPAVHLHVYDKRRVFERRKMGHVTALGADLETALASAQVALDALWWAEDGTTKEDR